MDLKSLWLSPKGRSSRKDLWLRTYLPFLGIYILTVIFDIVTGIFDSETGYDPILAILSILMTWPWTMVLIKRAHDRNRSGWFLLVSLVPILNLWPAIELYFFKGTEGSNRFGDDPLQYQN